MARQLRFLFLEPFFGGSHRDFAEGLAAHSRHRIDVVTLPARFWKWRMRGAAITFARKVGSLSAYDGLIATDLMSLADFKALAPPPMPPTLVYMHENQLTYPLAPGEAIDYQFGFTNLTSVLTADRVMFNSVFHHDAFFNQLPVFLNMMPEYVPKWAVERIRQKSGVLYPGCRFPAEVTVAPRTAAPPLVIWNHRWEFDKKPEDFFEAMARVQATGTPFRLALLGENFQAVPKAFLTARDTFGPVIVRYGYEPDRQRYLEWLRQGAVVVSTAQQENFGISMVEAIRFGCLPLLPDRLVYPEILPVDAHTECLYRGAEELVEKLIRHLTITENEADRRRQLSDAMAAHAWENRIGAYDAELERLAGV